MEGRGAGKGAGGQGDRGTCRGVRLSTAAIYDSAGGIKSTLASSRVLRDHWCYWGSGGRSSRSAFLWRSRGEGGDCRGSNERRGKRGRESRAERIHLHATHATGDRKKKDSVREEK